MERLPIPIFWPGEFHGLYSLWGRKESDTTEQLSLTSLNHVYGLKDNTSKGASHFYLFLAVPGLRCCMWYLSGCGAQASHCDKLLLLHSMGSRAQGLSSCSSQALEHRLCSCAQASLPRSMWDLPRSGIGPMSPALAGEFFTTGSPGKSSFLL